MKDDTEFVSLKAKTMEAEKNVKKKLSLNVQNFSRLIFILFSKFLLTFFPTTFNATHHESKSPKTKSKISSEYSN